MIKHYPNKKTKPMKDPHVDKLYYEMIIAEHTDYDKAPPIEEETEDFIMATEGKSVIFSMKKHFSSISEAQKISDDYLKRWEILIGVHHGPDHLTFKFINGELIDRSPTTNETGGTKIQAQPAVALALARGQRHSSRSKYPDLPKNFKLSPDVEMLYSRYKLYRENSETLLGMSYWCLTLLQVSAGGTRKKAEKKYHIHFNVLNKVGEISSTKGDEKEARKVKVGQPLIPLRPVEKNWIEAVIKAIIVRVGEHAYDPDAKFKKITMSDFPDLKD